MNHQTHAGSCRTLRRGDFRNVTTLFSPVLDRACGAHNNMVLTVIRKWFSNVISYAS